MQLQIAERKRAKIKMGLQGPSGSGKTYSALLIAYGLCNDWSKIAVIDSENHSSNLYAHLGKYKVVSTVSKRSLISTVPGNSIFTCSSLNFSLALKSRLLIVSLLVKKALAISLMPNPQRIRSANPICASVEIDG